MAAHLYKEENQVINVRETIAGGNDRATFENDLVELQLYTRMTKGNRGIFSVAISPREHESLTPEQEARAIEMIEKKFGLTGQTRLKMDHVKEGRAHSHLFWSLVDQDTGTLKDLSHYKRKLQTLGQDMEQEFNHEHTPRTPGEKTMEITDADRMIEGRTGRKAQDRKKEITAIWVQTKTGQDFLDQVREAGFDVAMGDKSRFVLIDQDGHTFNLARDLPRLVKVKDVRERFGDLQNELLSIQETQKQMKDRQTYDREQAEIDRQNRELDAADEAARTKAKEDHEPKPKAANSLSKKNVQVGKIQSVPDNHPIKLARAQDKKWEEIGKWSDAAHRRRLELANKLKGYYRPEETERNIQVLEKMLPQYDNLLGRMSGKFEAIQKELEARKLTLKSIRERMKEQTNKLEKEISKTTPSELIPANNGQKKARNKTNVADFDEAAQKGEDRDRVREAFKNCLRKDQESRERSRDQGYEM